ncbi:MAG: J domain-containing protein [Bdellovibrionales bacterium]|nr:J domain-containing protein [Massilia sp.]
MARIHTHYDNLKVSRKAPPEVIRAAYKALGQKYHPDKNPGDEKAARIMAILNSAYGTLADPVRRREHDEWIAAEEWEIEWLDSTRLEEGRESVRNDNGAWDADEPSAAPAYRPARDPRWWLAIGVSVALGLAGGVLLMSQIRVLPVALAGAPGLHAAALAAKSQPAAEALPDNWAVSGARLADTQQPQVKALAITQLVIPRRAPDCDAELHALVAPNGEQWPDASGYLSDFPIGNQGSEMQIVLDNSANTSPVLVKVYDLDRRSNVRHLYLLARESLTVDKLAAGKYEVRYQNIDVGGSRDDCVARRKARPAVVQTP